MLKGGAEKEWEPCNICICTHNPCTLRVDAAETSMDCELTRLNIGVCGQQETRDRTTFSKVFLERWWVAGTACTRMGQYGCRLWISLSTPWATFKERAVFPQAADIFTVIAEPTLLVVRMELPIYCVLFVVAYGPHSGRPAGEACSYWNGVAQKVLSVKRGGEKMILTTDANAHLHTATQLSSGEPLRTCRSTRTC